MDPSFLVEWMGILGGLFRLSELIMEAIEQWLKERRGKNGKCVPG
jgi:hypothetical protein